MQMFLTGTKNHGKAAIANVRCVNQLPVAPHPSPTARFGSSQPLPASLPDPQDFPSIHERKRTVGGGLGFRSRLPAIGFRVYGHCGSALGSRRLRGMLKLGPRT